MSLVPQYPSPAPTPTPTGDNPLAPSPAPAPALALAPALTGGADLAPGVSNQPQHLTNGHGTSNISGFAFGNGDMTNHQISVAGHPNSINTTAEHEQQILRADVETKLLKLAQDLYEMEVCAGDVAPGQEERVPNYLRQINQTFAELSGISTRMTDSVPRSVVDHVDNYKNPHLYTKSTLMRASGESQYTLGRMLGLESFRRQLEESLSAEFPSLPLPQRKHVPVRQGDVGARDEDEAKEDIKQEVQLEQEQTRMQQAQANGGGPAE